MLEKTKNKFPFTHKNNNGIKNRPISGRFFLARVRAKRMRAHINTNTQMRVFCNILQERKYTLSMKQIEFSIPKSPTFDIGQTLDCGQVFRFVKEGDRYKICAKNHMAHISDSGEEYRVSCDDKEFFEKYFDFDTDYAAIQAQVQDGGFVSEAIEYGKGIHILRQDPIEAIFSFIISQNNHIPRIKGIIERICNTLGEDMGEYHAFPCVERLASAGEGFYASIGAGYRAAYLDRVAKSLLDEDINEWQKLSTSELRAKLLSLYGVGRKVADCALLFGFSRFDVFPVDTWIKKAFESEYEGVTPEKMSDLLIQKYKENSGFVQQWAFYYKRAKKV